MEVIVSEHTHEWDGNVNRAAESDSINHGRMGRITRIVEKVQGKDLGRPDL